MLVRGALSIPKKHSMATHLFKSWPVVGEMLTVWGWLISVRITGPRVMEARCWHLTARKPGGNKHYV